MNTKKIFAMLIMLSVYGITIAAAVNNVVGDVTPTGTANVTGDVTPTSTVYAVGNVAPTGTVNVTENETAAPMETIEEPGQTIKEPGQTVEEYEQTPEQTTVAKTTPKSPGISAIGAIFVLAILGYVLRRR